jgi:hypothetical protein
LDKRETSGKMLFPLVVSIPIVAGTVVFIALIMILVAKYQGQALKTVPLITCGITMLIAGCASLIATQWARKNEQFQAVSGLIGVTTIMLVPLLVVIVTRVICENATAHLVFSYFVLYYLLFLPVGTWLILPSMPSQGKNKTDDSQSNFES